MFVQVIEGPVRETDAFHDQLDRWKRDLGDAAPGWLGTTAGVTREGTGLIAARFRSRGMAQTNADRPEQQRWWSETAAYFADLPSFTDYDDVTYFRAGGTDDATFVQVVRGTVNDPATARALFMEGIPDLERPEVLGGAAGILPDGSYTMIVFFTSEAEARVGEAAQEDSLTAQLQALHDTPPRYLDLTDPWRWTP